MGVLMLKQLSEFVHGEASLEVDKSGKPVSNELTLGTILALLNMAEADNRFADDEFRSIVASLNREFDLTDEEAGHLIEIAAVLKQDKQKSRELLDSVKHAFSFEQKEIVLSMLWKLVLADGLVEEFEASYAAKIREELGLSLEQGVRARIQAEKELTTTD